MQEEFKEITSEYEFMQEYWEGANNRFVRYWTYLRGGMGMFNEWKNYLLLAFGSYWTIKTSEIWLGYGISESWLIVGFIIGIPLGLLCLLLLGHWQLYRVAKPQEYINSQNGTITGFKPYNIQIRQLKLLEEINKKLK